MKNKIFVSIIIFFNFCNFIKAEVKISSKYAILTEEKTGIVLYGENIDVKRPIASLTKIMTAIIVLERGNLKDYVDISPRAKYRYRGESLINLEFNEKITVEELLYALLVKSANDAAIALAEHISGSVENFVHLMNKKAEEIGAKNTHFSNPHGFYGENHFSTCYDLSLITRYALKNEKFNEIIKTKEKLISWGNNPYMRILKNRNKLLWKYKYCDGVKTGMTKQAGYCLIASATKNGMRLISVVLNSQKIWEDSISLLEYGFRNYQKNILVREGETIRKINFFSAVPQTLEIVAAEDFWIPIKKSEKNYSLEKKIILKEITLPLKKGEKVGEMIFVYNGEVVGKIPLVAKENVRINYFLRCLTYLGISVIFFSGFIKYEKFRRKKKYLKIRRNYYGSSRFEY